MFVLRRYDPKSDSWTIIANMSVARDSVGVGVLGDRLFIIGGYDFQAYLTLVEMYDPVTNEWKQVSSCKRLNFMYRLRNKMRILSIFRCVGMPDE